MIETLLFKALQQDAALTAALTKYDNLPAIFYAQAPNDKAPGWNVLQYPRIDYMTNWQYEPERKTSGTITINAWCIAENEVTPEELGKLVQASLSDIFYTENGETYCSVWSRTDIFDVSGQTEPQISAATVTFDIIAFPLQATIVPDPISAAMQAIKTICPEAIVIGQDSILEIIRPTDTTPAFYVRLTSLDNAMKNQYAVTWMNAGMTIHVIAPSATARTKYIRKITEAIAEAGEVIMADGSPMFIQRLGFNSSSNPLITGQINITGQYGVLRPVESAPDLVNKNLNLKEV